MIKELGSSRGITENLLEVHLKRLSQREKNVILLAAQGKTVHETGIALFVSDATIKSHRLRAFRKIGVGQMESAIMHMLRRGDILPEEVLPANYDIQRLDSISKVEQRVLDTLTEEGRTQTSNEHLGKKLFLGSSTIKGHLSSIATKLGSSGREQTAAIAVCIQLLEQKTLTALPSAIYQEDFTKILHRSFHREIFARLQQKFATVGIFDTIVASIRNGKIDTKKLIAGFDEQKLSKLKQGDIDLLTRLIKDDGKSRTYTKIAQETGVTANDVAQRYAQIRNILEITIHRAVLYYALQYKNLSQYV